MKRFIILLWAVLLVLSWVPVVGATTYTYGLYEDVDPGGLDHYFYYTWQFNWTFDDPVTSASLSLNNIYNWDNQPHDLYIHLYDDSSNTSQDPLFTSYQDNQLDVDSLGPDGLLAHYDETNFTDALTSYDISFPSWALEDIADGKFTIGIDPDCHYYADELILSAETAPIPEPATLLLLGTGIVGLAACRTKFRR